MPLPAIHIWKKAPFIRFLLPLISGIILQWYLQIQPAPLWTLLLSPIITISFFFIPFFERYKLSVLVASQLPDCLSQLADCWHGIKTFSMTITGLVKIIKMKILDRHTA